MLILLALFTGCSKSPRKNVDDSMPGDRTVTRGSFNVTAPEAVGENDVDSVMNALETAKNKVAARLKMPIPPLELQAEIYRTTQDYVAATGAEYYMGAFYSDGILRIQPVRALRDRGILQQTITHEYVHFYLSVLTNGNCPAWLDEGIATLIGGENGKCESGRAALENFDSFENLSAAFDMDGERETVEAAYRAACFSAAFIEKHYGNAGLSGIISGIRRGKDIDSAFQGAIKTTPDNLFANIMKTP